MSKAQTHQTIVGKNDEWETPKELLYKKIKELNINPIIDGFTSSRNCTCKNLGVRI